MDVLVQRVTLLEEVNLQPALHKQQGEDEQLHILASRLKELEGEIERIKDKSQALSRFKR